MSSTIFRAISLFCDLFVTYVRSMRRIATIASVEAAKSVPNRQVEYPDVKVPGLALRVFARRQQVVDTALPNE
jgi:hypothetical protein